MTMIKPLGNGHPRGPSETYGRRIVPRGPAPVRMRVLAGIFDAGVFLLPLLVGWYVVQSLRDENGGGEADRAVFGGTAIAIAVGLLVWNLGFREGATGRTSGKGWVGLVTRDAKTKQPIGVRRALRRPFDRTGIEVVRESTAREEGFEELARDNSVGATRRRRLIGLAVLTVLLALVMLASIAVGARPLTFAEIFHAIFSSDGTQTDIIVRTLRAPRTILGLVVGIALGIAGALIQGHTRNPLADAGLLGLNAGAAFFVVMAIYLFGFTAPSQYLWFAFAGSFVASIVVFGLSSIGNGGASPSEFGSGGRSRRVLPASHDQCRDHPRPDQSGRLPFLGSRVGVRFAGSTSSGRSSPS